MTDSRVSDHRRDWRTLGLAILIAASAAAFGGCAGSGDMVLRRDFVPFSPEQKTDLEVRSTHSYRIQEGDLLKVYFAYERDLNQDGVVVLNDGSVSLIGVGNIKLAGLTLSEADSVLTDRYSREYREPALSVLMQETSGRRVYVLGEVKTPGLHRLPMGGIDLMGAIAVAGGFTDDAAKSGTVVVKISADGYHFIEVDMGSFGSAEFVPLATLALESYDIVYVPQSRIADFGYFSRNVLAGLSYITRMIYDVRAFTDGTLGRY